MFPKHILPLVEIAAFLLFCLGTTKAQNTTSPSARDRKFMRLVMEGENAEAALGQLAVEKGSGDDIKRFGQTMIDDQAQLFGQMRDVAKKEHIHAPVGTTTRDRELEARLKKLRGTSFDKAYIAATVKDQRRDLDEFNREANHGNDTAIKDAAGRGALLIGQQLQLAEQIAHGHKMQL